MAMPRDDQWIRFWTAHFSSQQKTTNPPLHWGNGGRGSEKWEGGQSHEPPAAVRCSLMRCPELELNAELIDPVPLVRSFLPWSLPCCYMFPCRAEPARERDEG